MNSSLDEFNTRVSSASGLEKAQMELWIAYFEFLKKAIVPLQDADEQILREIRLDKTYTLYEHLKKFLAVQEDLIVQPNDLATIQAPTISEIYEYKKAYGSGWTCFVPSSIFGNFYGSVTTVYIKPGSFIPYRPAFEFLRSEPYKCYKKTEYMGEGFLVDRWNIGWNRDTSDGIVLPSKYCPSIPFSDHKVGDDVTYLIGARKFLTDEAIEQQMPETFRSCHKTEYKTLINVLWNYHKEHEIQQIRIEEERTRLKREKEEHERQLQHETLERERKERERLRKLQEEREKQEREKQERNKLPNKILRFLGF